MSGARTVEAAGGVLWRPAVDGSPEVALVHRPRYDDWSLPKGKLDDGEHPLAGALRETREETGSRAVPGRPLGELTYTAFGRPKRVRYWALRSAGGEFTAGREVDEVSWEAPATALARLSADRDRVVLTRFLDDVRDTVVLVVVRHASAGDRDTWTGPDAERPLDPRGLRQARVLGELLQAYGVEVARTAEVLRCHQTLAPFLAASGLAATTEPGLTAGAPCRQPDAGVDVLASLAGRPAVACSQRELMAALVAGVCSRLGHPLSAEQVGEPDKGAPVVLHVTTGAVPRLVDWECLPPPD